MDCDDLREDVLAAFSEHGLCAVKQSDSDFSQDTYGNNYRKFAAVCKDTKPEMTDIVYGGCE